MAERLTFTQAVKHLADLAPALEAAGAEVTGVSFRSYVPDTHLTLQAKSRADLDRIVALLEDATEPRMYGDYSAPSVEVYGIFTGPAGSVRIQVFGQSV